MNLPELFLPAAERHPHHVAVKDRLQSLTYMQLTVAADAVASTLMSAGLLPRDRVAVLLDSSVDYVIAYLGILRGGCVAVPLNTDNSRTNILFVLEQCGAKGLVAHTRYLRRYEVWETCARRLTLLIPVGEGDVSGYGSTESASTVPRILPWSEAVSCRPEGPPFPNITGREPACILYTSGTTGVPKGVMLSHGNLVANTRSIISYLNLREGDSVLAVLPFFYSYGSSLLHTHLAVGGTVVIERQFVYPNKALERMREEEVTGFAGVPSTFALLLHRSNFRKMDWPHLRYVTQAGGPMAPALARELKEALPRADIYIMYGQTEATARLSYLPPDRFLEKPDSIGKAIPGVELQVVDEHGRPVPPDATGEIIARGENIMQGYCGLPGENVKVLRDGWLHTGDLARVDDEGFIYIVSRKSEMIKSGAHRISPKEIENVIADVPEVYEVAVVGWPDLILGEAIWAFLVPKENCSLDHGAILRHCRTHLASFKVPHKLVELAELPKTTSGKIKKFLLKEA